MSGRRVERSIRSLRHAPYHGLVGAEDRVEFGRDRQPAIPAQRNTREAPADEVAVGVHLPRRGSAGKARRQKNGGEHGGPCERTNDNLHSFTSTWMVLVPEITMSPPSISMSATLALRVCERPATV